ncbi:multi-sensor hybrid histidine kinase [Candidatus Magnetomorum sp. HK-1]|nr:multi-sensor hybrid histidine kinase [Candidatus Magnetomorum sp. HK-1]
MISISTKQRFYLIVGLLILIFCIGYIELAVFISELSFGAEKVQKAAYIEKDVQQIKQDFWKLRFWERAIQTKSHAKADQQFGETIRQIRQQLINFSASPFDERFTGKTEPVNEILTRYENAFNKLVQLKTDQRLSQTQIESNFQVLSSTILISNDFSLLKPLLNLDRFLDRYIQNKTSSEYKALRMVFIFFEKKLKHSEIMNERINSYIKKLDNLIENHFDLEKKIHVINQQFDDFSLELMNSFNEISQTAENIGRQSIENGSHLQKNIFYWMIISVFVSALILLFIIDIIARKVIKPIRMLWEVVMKVQSGDEHARYRSNSKDEIAHLGFALNSMLDTINNHRHRLEEIVNERTSELTETNHQMRQEIEQRKKAQELANQMALEAEIANKAKSAFLANMSHEIRTPMNAVINMTDFVLETQLTKRQREFLSIIKSSGKGLLGIINDILDLSKIESGKMELEKTEFNLQDSFDFIADMFRDKCEQKKLKLIISIGSNVPKHLIGDPLRLKQVIVNLTNNAIKFTDNGEICIQVKLLNQINNDIRLKISVKDTGIGIPQNSLEKLFAPFTQADNSTTRKYGGTGLGLTICKQIVEMMDGKIWAESTEGKGSIFSFTTTFNKASDKKETLQIPIKNKHSKMTLSVDKQASEQNFDNYSILLVEDNIFNRHVALEILKQGTFTNVDTADNGKKAIESLELKLYDLILMDIQMPEMDGFQATRYIRKQPAWKDIPIIAMTANALKGDRKACIDAGMNDYITKPINRKEFIKKLKQWRSN